MLGDGRPRSHHGQGAFLHRARLAGARSALWRSGTDSEQPAPAHGGVPDSDEARRATMSERMSAIFFGLIALIALSSVYERPVAYRAELRL